MARKPVRPFDAPALPEWLAALGDWRAFRVPVWLPAAMLAAVVATMAMERISYLGMPAVFGRPGAGMLLVMTLVAYWADPPLAGIGTLPVEEETDLSAWLGYASRFAVGLLLLLVPLSGSTKVLDTYDLPKQSTCTILQVVMLMAWSAARVAGRRAPAPVHWLTGYAAPVFIMAAALSVPRAVNPVVAAMEVGRIALGVATLLAVHDHCRDIEFARRVLGLGTVTALAICGLSIRQAMNYDIEGFPQVIAPAACFGNKNMATEYLVLLFPIALGVMLWGRHVLTVLAGALGSLTFVFVLGVSHTRADWAASFGLVLVMVLSYLWQISQRGKGQDAAELLRARARQAYRLAFALLVLGLGLVLVYNVEGIAKRFGKDTVVAQAAAQGASTTFDVKRHSTVWRVAAYSNSLMMVVKNPIFGVGAANWQFRYPLYHDAWMQDEAFDTHTQATTLHNDFLQYQAELGLPGGLAFIFLFVALAMVYVNCLADLPGTWGPIGIAAAASTVAAGVDGLFSFPFKLACPTLMFWICAAVAHRASREITGLAEFELSGPDEARDLARRTPALLMASTLGGAMLAGWAVSDWKASASLKSAYVLSNESRWAEAAKEFQSAAEDMPYVYNTYLLLGRAYYTLGQLWNGVAANKLAAVYHPFHCNIYYNMANCYRDLGRHSEAVDAFRKSCELYRGNADAWNNMANILKAMGKIDEAIAAYREAVKHAPFHQEAYLNLSALLGSLNRGPEALELLKKGLSVNPRFYKAHQGIGNVYQSMNKVPEAIKAYEAAVALDPGYVEALNNLAGSYWKLGDGTKALANFERALALSPQFAPSYFGMADIYYQARRRDAAINGYTRFLELWPGADQHRTIAQQRLVELRSPTWAQTPTAPQTVTVTATAPAGGPATLGTGTTGLGGPALPTAPAVLPPTPPLTPSGTATDSVPLSPSAPVSPRRKGTP